MGGIPVGKGTLQIQVLNPALSQMPVPQPAGPVLTQVKHGHISTPAALSSE